MHTSNLFFLQIGIFLANYVHLFFIYLTTNWNLNSALHSHFWTVNQNQTSYTPPAFGDATIGEYVEFFCLFDVILQNM